MSYLATQAEAVVVASTDPSNRPTRGQVTRIAQLTHSGQTALETVQQTLYKRIVHPESYQPLEIEYTLVVIQQCSFIGSVGFVAFFKERIYAIASLANYTSASSDSGTIARVQSKAQILSRLLQDDKRLQKERSKSVVVIASTTIDPTSFSETAPSSNVRHPVRGRSLRSWREWDSDTRSSTSSSATYLPTPDPSPERGGVHQHDNPSNGGHDDENPTEAIWEGPEQVVRKVIEASPPEIPRDKMDAMVDMTFESKRFHILLGVLVERLSGYNGEWGHRQLVKALKVIKHCLINGSIEFFTWFRENRGMIAELRDVPVTAVSQLAEEIVLRLDRGGGLRAGGRTGTRQRSRSTSPSTPSFSDVAFSTGPTSVSFNEPVKDLTAFVTTVGEHPIANGGYSIVYKAILTIGQSKEVVAKKILSKHSISPARHATRINREISAWTRLSHPNIAELYGITFETNGSVGLISPFFENGNIEEYLRNFRTDVLRMMIEIALGVEYLHSQNIVHGDIKASNIMVDKDGHAKLIDFGLSRIPGERGNTTSGPGISWAYAAPELLLLHDDDPIPKTKSSDIYALAITFVQESLCDVHLIILRSTFVQQIMTGRAPYYGMNNYAILERVRHGDVPDRPSPGEECNFYPEDNLWAMLLCCWAKRPEDRPVISTVRDMLLSLESSA